MQKMEQIELDTHRDQIVADMQGKRIKNHLQTIV